MDSIRAKELRLQAVRIKQEALKAIQSACSGHVGGSFSVAEILAVLYFEKMNIDPANPKKHDRDRFVLSKGHCSPALYATLALRGYFPVEELKSFRNVNSNLSGHVEMTHVSGVDMSAGSLGQGFSTAVGMALSARIDKLGNRVFAVLGDGEIQEGQIWEAAMAAGHYKLDNLVAFVDNNDLQIDGSIADVMSPYPIDAKFRAFNWNVITIDGHDTAAISAAVDLAATIKSMPTVIIARTVKGHGISFMENECKWHGNTPCETEYTQAFAELEAQINELEA